MMSSLSLVIMAAGMGSRYGGLKQLDKFGPQGQTMMDYAIKDAIDTGFNHLVFIIRQSFVEDFKKSVGDKYDGKLKVDYVFQELSDVPAGYELNEAREKPWGTGHAILAARQCVSNNFAVINADDYYGKEAFELLVKHFDKNPNNYCNVVYPIINTLSDFGGVSRGICSSENDFLTKIEEVHGIQKKQNTYSSDSNLKLDDKTTVSMNCWGFNPDVFDCLITDFNIFCQQGKLAELKSEFLLPEVIDKIISEKSKQVNVVVCNSLWYGITYQEDRQYVCQQLVSLES